MQIENWGLVEYESSVKRQLETLERVHDGADEVLIVCSHPPVVTTGRGTKPGDLSGWSGALSESSRGGRATYHGPNQVVIYPIMDLRREHAGLPTKDVHAYLRWLEDRSVATLKHLGLSSAEAREEKNLDGVSMTGVWVGNKKIASIGIAVRKWITYHGVAINIDSDANAFQGINPCGFQSSVMTSLEEQLGRRISRETVIDSITHSFR